MSLTLRIHAGEYAVCRLAPHDPPPSWVTQAAGFTSITRTADELSIVCAAGGVPAAVKHDGGWALLELVGPFPFEAVGILSSVLTPLAAARVSCLTIATHDTDYVLVKAGTLAAARAALERAGHRFVE
ncbi:MAG TPA: ACT domain-containing protein [Opitutaceae bacterium]|nr:ACT domain-containing protein [Opitutaceae bacterium]